MYIFNSIKKQLTRFGIYRPHAPNESNHFNSRNLILISIYGVSTILMGVSVFSSKTMSEYSICCSMTSALFILFYLFCVIVSQKPTIYILIDKFEMIMQKRIKNGELKTVYEKKNQKIEKWIKLLSMLMNISIFVLTTPTLFYMMYIDFARGLENDHSLLPTWLPFNWKLPFVGYYPTLFLNVIVLLAFTQIVIFITSFLLGSYFTLIEFIKDVKREIAILNENWKTNQNQVELMEKHCEIFWFIARINECIKELTEIFEQVLTAYLVWSVIAICFSLLVLDAELAKDEIDYVLVGFLCGTIPYSFGIIFIFCEIGEQLSSQLDEIDDAICELDWYTFPLRAQRMMTMNLLITQHPSQLTGFGGVRCCRDTFKRVVNGGYSYFNIFRV